MMKRAILAICFAMFIAASAVDADIIYTGSDNGAGPGDALPGSDAAAALFDADAGAIGAMELCDFESLTPGYFTNLVVAPGVTATTTGTRSPGLARSALLFSTSSPQRGAAWQDSHGICLDRCRVRVV